MNSIEGNDLMSENVHVAGNRMITMVRDGKIKKHIMRNSSEQHAGEKEERELLNFRDFIPTKNFDIIYQLVGCEIYE